MSLAVLCVAAGLLASPMLLACLHQLDPDRDPRSVHRLSVWAGVAAVSALVVRGARFPGSPDLLAWCWLVVFGVVLAVIDWLYRRLPHPLTAALGLGGLVLLTVASAQVGRFDGLWRGVVAAAVVGLVTVGLHLLRPAGFGGGDAVLLPVLALFLGYLGWEHLLRGLLLSFLLTGVVAAALLATGRARWGQGAGFPAGPPLIAGALFVVIFH
ncbi:prepilin peptidase [Crossiella sp. CA198]|uniref:prepilin peptidase n=1 Tax=Crossiella sp. CA198 TaxID=3455607 RepID=UPI003F8CFF79